MWPTVWRQGGSGNQDTTHHKILVPPYSTTASFEASPESDESDETGTQRKFSLLGFHSGRKPVLGNAASGNNDRKFSAYSKPNGSVTQKRHFRVGFAPHEKTRMQQRGVKVICGDCVTRDWIKWSLDPAVICNVDIPTGQALSTMRPCTRLTQIR